MYSRQKPNHGRRSFTCALPTFTWAKSEIEILQINGASPMSLSQGSKAGKQKKNFYSGEKNLKCTQLAYVEYFLWYFHFNNCA
jgi:hypothetical protein